MEATKLNSVDLVIGALEKDNECTKSMLDWIVARIYDIEYGSKDWKLDKIKNGYRLSSDCYSFDYFYNSFVCSL